MIYKCCFPGCTYTTENRSLIEYHHIHPRELMVQHSKNVTIPLCATHHKMIYHPDATFGQHSEKTADSMLVKTVTHSSVGRCVVFEDMLGVEHPVFLEESVSGVKVFVIGWNAIEGLYERPADDADDDVLAAVDRCGYCKESDRVYYADGNRQTAVDLLHAIISLYAVKVEAEYAELRRKIADSLTKLGQ